MREVTDLVNRSQGPYHQTPSEGRRVSGYGAHIRQEFRTVVEGEGTNKDHRVGNGDLTHRKPIEYEQDLNSLVVTLFPRIYRPRGSPPETVLTRTFRDRYP